MYLLQSDPRFVYLLQSDPRYDSTLLYGNLTLALCIYFTLTLYFTLRQSDPRLFSSVDSDALPHFLSPFQPLPVHSRLAAVLRVILQSLSPPSTR